MQSCPFGDCKIIYSIRFFCHKIVAQHIQVQEILKFSIHTTTLLPQKSHLWYCQIILGFLLKQSLLLGEVDFCGGQDTTNPNFSKKWLSFFLKLSCLVTGFCVEGFWRLPKLSLYKQHISRHKFLASCAISRQWSWWFFHQINWICWIIFRKKSNTTTDAALIPQITFFSSKSRY